MKKRTGDLGLCHHVQVFEFQRLNVIYFIFKQMLINELLVR